MRSPVRALALARAHTPARALTAVACAGACLTLGPPGPALVSDTNAKAVVPTTTPASALAAAVARNRQAALWEARALLRSAPVPPGAVRATAAAEALAGGPVLGTPAVSSLVVQTQFWRAPLSFEQAGAWLMAHPPKGLTPAGSSNGNGPGAGQATVGYGYTAPSTAQYQSPELEIGAASLGPSSSALRVDAVVIWTDPRPWPDDAPGRRAHVTVADGCLASASGVVGVSNPGAGLTASLLPAGQPTAALVCRYNGANGPSGALPPSQFQKLAHQARLRATGAEQLARTVSAAPPSRTVVPVNGSLRCPMDDGAVALLALAYPGRLDVDIWAQLGGCTLVGNVYILGAGWDIVPRVKMYG